MGKINWWPRGTDEELRKKVEPTPPQTEEKKVDMSRFISKPQTIEAVKWDGSPEGAAEVKAMLERSKFVMEGFNVSYTSDGKLDKRNTIISYYQEKGGRKPDREDYPYYHKTYSLKDGWLVVESPGAAPKTVSDEQFKKNYQELGQVSYEDFLEWVSEAT